MVMPPGDKPKRAKYTEYLARKDIHLAGNSSLGNAEKLGAWVEWLKHPEDHDGARVVSLPNGGKQEADGNVGNPDNPPPPGYYVDDTMPETLPDRDGNRAGQQYYLPYESVVEDRYFSEFFGPQTAVSTQHVERPEAPFAGMVAIMAEIIWRLDDFNFRLADTPDKIEAWHGEAGRIYGESAAAMCDLNTKIQELLDGFIPTIAEYCALIKRTREALDKSAGTTIGEFTKRIPNASTDVVGEWITSIVFSTANASGKELTQGTKSPLSDVVGKNLVSVLWDVVFDGVLGMIKAASEPYTPPPTWTEIAGKHLSNQEKILAGATARMRELGDEIVSLQNQLTAAAIPPLPQK